MVTSTEEIAGILKQWWLSPNTDTFRFVLNFIVLGLALYLFAFELLHLKEGIEKPPPLWFKISDIFIIFSLIFEVFLDWLSHDFNCRRFLHSWFNVIDVVVVVLSVVGVIDYLTGEGLTDQELYSESFFIIVKSITIRSVRIARVVMLLIRCYYDFCDDQRNPLIKETTR